MLAQKSADHNKVKFRQNDQKTTIKIFLLKQKQALTHKRSIINIDIFIIDIITVAETEQKLQRNYTEIIS